MQSNSRKRARDSQIEKTLNASFQAKPVISEEGDSVGADRKKVSNDNRTNYQQAMINDDDQDHDDNRLPCNVPENDTTTTSMTKQSYHKLPFEDAVRESLFEPDQLSPLEQRNFPNVNQRLYLRVRNHILNLWFQNLSTQLTLDLAYEKLTPDETKVPKFFFSRIFDFLQRHCFINYGIFTVTRPIVSVNSPSSNESRRRRKVLIIGAGIAGISAARQLRNFGFDDITILEASSRAGGRIRKIAFDTETSLDAGCSLISGVRGNRIKILIEQLGLNVTQLRSTRNTYCDGLPVPSNLEAEIEAHVAKMCTTLLNAPMTKMIIDAATTSSTSTDVMSADKLEDISVETAFQIIVAWWELSAKRKLLRRMQNARKILENATAQIHQMEKHNQQFMQLSSAYCAENAKSISATTTVAPDSTKSTKPENNQNVADEDNRPPQDDFCLDDQFFDDAELRRFSFDKIYDIQNSFHCLQNFETKYLDFKQQYNRYIRQEAHSIDTHFTLHERRLLQWHFAIFEMQLGCSLSRLSFREFAARRDMSFLQANFFCPDGCVPILSGLIGGAGNSLDIKFDTMVNKIELKPQCVVVETWNKKKKRRKCITADAVICTVPLGVLKRSIESQSSSSNQIRFQPPLPKSKIEAISRLGFGTVNKVILCYSRAFWRDHIHRDHFFGNVALPGEGRGELIAFFCEYTQPILTAIVCGEAADSMPNPVADTDQLIVSRCQVVLRQIFRPDPIPAPKYFAVTAWKHDHHFGGTHSYVAVGASREDYNVLAESVSLADDQQPRLFFAGEHTDFEFPGTVHGAYASGLREAGKIMQIFAQ